MARALEILRATWPNFGQSHLDAFLAWAYSVLLPQMHYYIDEATPLALKSGKRQVYGNWHASVADAYVAIGVLADNRALYDKGRALYRKTLHEYLKWGRGHAPGRLLGETTETLRDIYHTEFGLGSLVQVRSGRRRVPMEQGSRRTLLSRLCSFLPLNPPFVAACPPSRPPPTARLPATHTHTHSLQTDPTLQTKQHKQTTNKTTQTNHKRNKPQTNCQVAETAWTQNEDLYQEADYALAAALELHARIINAFAAGDESKLPDGFKFFESMPKPPAECAWRWVSASAFEEEAFF